MDMLMYIIIPNRRNVANSLMIMLSHLFGDASGPIIIGIISDFLRKDDDSSLAKYKAFEKAFYLPNLLLIISGVTFLLCAWNLPKDIRRFKIDTGNAIEKQEKTKIMS